MHQSRVPVYLDYHATTPVDDRVLEAMLPYFNIRYGNAASRSHSFGWQAEEAVEIARNQVSDLLQARAKDIFFTSGSTEGLNMAIKGMAEAYGEKRKHIITFATEHHAVLDVVTWLKSKNFEISILPVSRDGSLDLELIKQQLRPDTMLVACMWANNETGVIHDLAAVVAMCHEMNVPVVCDATQAVGKIEVHPEETGVDILAFSAHKFYGPKGVGGVYVHPKLKIKPVPLLHGGGHESGFRSGTLNVPGIVGMGVAAKICKAEMKMDMERIAGFRNFFEKKVVRELEETGINGNLHDRLPTVSNLCARYTDSQAVMTRFRSKLAISSGSACSSADPSPSHVLLAMGLSEAEAKGSYRFSFGRPTTEEEVEEASQLFIDAVTAYRAASPVWQMHKQEIRAAGP